MKKLLSVCAFLLALLMGLTSAFAEYSINWQAVVRWARANTQEGETDTLYESALYRINWNDLLDWTAKNWVEPLQVVTGGSSVTEEAQTPQPGLTVVGGREGYHLPALGGTLVFPESLRLLSDIKAEGYTSLTFALKGRTDVNYLVNVAQHSTYDGVFMTDLPQALLDSMHAYYTNLLPGCKPEYWVDENGLTNWSPYAVSGSDGKGNYYTICTIIRDGVSVTVSVGSKAETLDEAAETAFTELRGAVNALLIMGEVQP